MADRARTCPTCGGAFGPDALFCPRDGAPLGALRHDAGRDPYVGQRVAGHIDIERLVGIGAMGRVYRAAQAGIDRPVAVKILHPEHRRDAALVARFHREGRVAGSLVHPHVVTVHAAGVLDGAIDAEPVPYLVMEFLDGLSLRSALAARDAPLPVTRALRVALQICDAIGEAHARCIVHRDLKPENVMLVPAFADPDFVKVVDFGVARVGEADTSIATHAGAILGSATYASPESARGDRLGPPSDVYSIATLLFECLAGRPPFVGKGPVDLLIQHAKSAPPDLRATAGGASVPEPIALVVERGLAKDPGARFATARELGVALVTAARRSGEDLARLVGPRSLMDLVGGRDAENRDGARTLLEAGSPRSAS